MYMYVVFCVYVFMYYVCTCILASICAKLNILNKPIQIYNVDETGVTVVEKLSQNSARKLSQL